MLKNEVFYEQYSLMCRTITNPVRLKIIELIGTGKKSVGELQESLGVSMSNLSNHLGALYKLGILSREKKGNFVYYSLTEPQLLDVLKMMRKVIESIMKKRNECRG